MITVSVEWLQHIEAALVGLCRDYRENHGLDGAWDQTLTDGEAALTAIFQKISQIKTSDTVADSEPTCNPDPRAPHGFDRNASHNAGRYCCTCEGWQPEPTLEPMPVTQDDIEELWDAVVELRELIKNDQ